MRSFRFVRWFPLSVYVASAIIRFFFVRFECSIETVRWWIAREMVVKQNESPLFHYSLFSCRKRTAQTQHFLLKIKFYFNCDFIFRSAVLLPYINYWIDFVVTNAANIHTCTLLKGIAFVVLLLTIVYFYNKYLSCSSVSMYSCYLCCVLFVVVFSKFECFYLNKHSIELNNSDKSKF